MSVVIAKNQTAAALSIGQIPIPDNEIPASGQATLSDYANMTEIQEDPQLTAYIAAGDVILNVDGADLSAGDSASYATPLSAATVAEVNTGTDGSKAVVPSSLAGSTLATNVTANNAKVSADGLVTTHSDVSSAGSGAIVTGAERTKLTGIEEAADVTDATNVAAAGAVMETLADAKGDVLVATANDTVIRLPVGTDTHVLTADSAQASGVKWAAAGGGGSVYGSEYESELDTTFRSTTGNSFFEAQKFTTASKPAGTYRIEFNYIWSLNNASSDFKCQVTVDDSTQLYAQTDGGDGSYDLHQQEAKDRDGSGDGGTNQRYVLSYWADVTFAASGTHEIDIDIASSQNGIEASIYRSTIAIYRVS